MQKLIEFTAKSWSKEILVMHYKRARFIVEINELSDYNQKQLESFSCLDYNISGSVRLLGKDIIPESMQLNFNNYGIPVLLHKHKIVPTEYVTYNYKHGEAKKTIHIQKNGFLVYCAPTGQGKTFFALTNLMSLSKQFDTILYINLELSIDDIKNRCETMEIDVPHNLYVSPLDSVEVIQEWAANKGSCAFIVDNIDNLVGGGQDPFGAQLDFIKDLDRYLKDNNHHALVLTQLVKDNNMTLLGKDGEVNDGITTNILSGVKQLSYLSRSVMMTAFSPELEYYSYKILKVGSAKYDKW